MKRMWIGICAAIFIVRTSFSCHHPEAALQLLSSVTDHVYFGETISIPMRMDYSDLAGEQWWEFSEGVNIEFTGGDCPPIYKFDAIIGSGTCFLNMLVTGQKFEETSRKGFSYRAARKSSNFCKKWDKTFASPEVLIKTIPHPMAINLVKTQEGTVHLPFNMPLISLVNYYHENVQAGNQPEIVVTPAALDGLVFDSETQQLLGTPTRVGDYHFQMVVKSLSGVSKPRQLVIMVKPDERDRPVFKSDSPDVLIIIRKPFQFNLLNLLEPAISFMDTNQVHFKIASINPIDTGLVIREDNITLEGIVNDADFPSEISVNLVAISNTGVESFVYEWHIPVVNP